MNSKSTAVLAALSLCLAAGTALADPHADANAAHARGDYAAELAILKPAAERGEVWAQNNLGLLYANGDGVPQDDAIAARWLQKAADKGDQTAQLNLMRMDTTDRAKSADPAPPAEVASAPAPAPASDVETPKAAEPEKPHGSEVTTTHAAEADKSAPAAPVDPHAAAHAADKRGDYATEIAILKPAAEKGEVWAENNLGLRYANGQGVPQDNALATKWLEKAAAAGDANAKRNLLGLYFSGNAKPSDPKEAAEYDKGKTLMQITELGMNCMLKKPTAAEDCPKAAALLRKSAEGGDPEFEERLGQAYMVGSMGLPRDMAQAFAWTQKAADQGLESAERSLANYYSFGMGVEQDEAKAVVWLAKAAQQGDQFSAMELAQDYEEGHGVAMDEAQAFNWYLKAADDGNPDAQQKVAAAYAYGKGAPRDDVKAYVWLDIATSNPISRDETRDAQLLALKAVKARLTPEQLAKAEGMVAQWKEAHPSPFDDAKAAG
jgi:TPR repeat protein